jgi:hypothetical protein
MCAAIGVTPHRTGRDVRTAVLITAAFCMFNRYVDGLGTFAPEDRDAYAPMAHQIVEFGYGHTGDVKPVG